MLFYSIYHGLRFTTFPWFAEELKSPYHREKNTRVSASRDISTIRDTYQDI